MSGEFLVIAASARLRQPYHQKSQPIDRPDLNAELLSRYHVALRQDVPRRLIARRRRRLHLPLRQFLHSRKSLRCSSVRARTRLYCCVEKAGFVDKDGTMLRPRRAIVSISRFGTLFMAEPRISSIAAAATIAADLGNSQKASTELAGPFRLVPKPDRREVFDRRSVYRGGRRMTDKARSQR
jgi:hypothetical protein